MFTAELRPLARVALHLVQKWVFVSHFSRTRVIKYPLTMVISTPESTLARDKAQIGGQVRAATTCGAPSPFKRPS